jgi:hypothetical protein
MSSEVGVGIDHPSDRHCNAAKGHHQFWAAPRAEDVDDPSLDRRQPRFQRNEDRKGDLDRGDRPTVRFVDRIDEQRPTVLQVGDHYHAKKPQRTVETLSARTKFDVVVVIVRILPAPAFLSI